MLSSDQKGTFTDFVEQGSRTVTYKTDPVPLFDVSYGVEVLRGLFIQGAVSRVNGSRTAEIEEQVPHPFLFGQMRTLKGTATDLSRDEIAVHFQAGAVAPLGRRLQVGIAGGPSFFKLKQTFVTDVAYSQEYPYDTVTYTSATTALSEKNRWGFNVQGNVTYQGSVTVSALISTSSGRCNGTRSNVSGSATDSGLTLPVPGDWRWNECVSSERDITVTLTK